MQTTHTDHGSATVAERDGERDTLIKVQRRALACALRRADRAFAPYASRSFYERLVRISASKGLLSVEARTLRASITVELSATTEGTLDIVLNSAALRDALAAFAGEQIELRTKQHAVVLSDSGVELPVPTESRERWAKSLKAPGPKRGDWRTVVAAPAGELARALAAAHTHAARYGNLLVLEGIHLRATAKKATITASDGYRMLTAPLPGACEQFAFTLPAEALHRATQSPRGGEEITIEWLAECCRARISRPGERWLVQALPQNYPRLRPQHGPEMLVRASVARTALLSATRAACANAEPRDVLSLAVADQKVRLSVDRGTNQSPEPPFSATLEVHSTISGEPTERTLDPRLLASTLEVLEAQQIEIGLCEPKRPIRLFAGDQEVLIMPRCPAGREWSSE